VVASGPGTCVPSLIVTEAPTTVWHAWRRHVDLCRTSAAICRSWPA